MKKAIRNIQRVYKKLIKKNNVKRSPENLEILEKATEINQAYAKVMGDFGVDSKKEKKILGFISQEYFNEDRRSAWSDDEGYVPYSKRERGDYQPDSDIQKDALYPNK